MIKSDNKRDIIENIIKGGNPRDFLDSILKGDKGENKKDIKEEIREIPKKTNSSSLLEKKVISQIYESSNVGYSGEGCPKKVNQDICFVYDNFKNNPSSKYLGVW